MNNIANTGGRCNSAPILPIAEQIILLPEAPNDSFDATACAIFMANYGDNHRYICDEKYWIYWDGAHWFADTNAQQLYNALELMRTCLQEHTANCHLAKIAKNLSNQRSLTSIKKHLESRAELSLKSTDCDSHEHLAAFMNAVYNTDTAQFIYKPEQIRPLYLLKRFPVAYDASAECPQWEQFLNTIFMGDAELIHFVQKAVGLSLSGKVLEEKLFFAYGSGANGKTTFFEVLNRIFGSFHREIDPMVMIKSKVPDQRLLLENMANLKAIRFATSNEIPERATYNDMAVKQLCSRDMISGKVVYQSVCEFKPTHKLWIRSNHKPLFNVRDGGMLRRICLVPFGYKVPPEAMIERFEDVLTREAKGILKWIVEGWQSYRKEGMRVLPKAMILAQSEYTLECDSLRQYIDEQYVSVDSKMQAYVPLKDFTAGYNAWCKENSFRGSNARALAGELRAEGYEVVVGHGNLRIIKGISKVE